ncbi:glycosaminoglycan xylosylkinase-like [Penaeus japonicus]|uniref:glycosaminoglycan xylosylkinase-like n=1 Tax=Penaeus japonicus TaxID=27405 RepID=UPI001C70FE04|nr:glycosaminoglycan xylosylkinase-like [Penaeus japonicus]
MCFFAKCDRCNTRRVKCADQDDSIEGAVIMWVPEHLRLSTENYPWQHYYKRKEPVKWEHDEHFCEAVSVSDQGKRLLDLIDMSVLDFLIQNTDRHHYLYVNKAPSASAIPVDHGKSFADPYVDQMDIMASILQCCRIRAATYERLVLLSGGGMSLALQELLALDPVAPVLTRAHLRATDRRVTHLLAALTACSDKKGGWSNVLS